MLRSSPFKIHPTKGCGFPLAVTDSSTFELSVVLYVYVFESCKKGTEKNGACSKEQTNPILQLSQLDGKIKQIQQ